MAKQWRWLILLGVGLLLGTAAFGLAGIHTRNTPYHPDEGMWTAAGKAYFQRFFIDRDFRYSSWSDPRFGGFGIPNPVLGKYIIGAGLFLSGAVETDTVFPGYDFPGNLNWDLVKDSRPPDNALAAARRPVKWLGAGSAVLLLLLVGLLLKSWITAVLAALIFMFQPLVLEYSNRAMMDMPVLFFSLLALAAAAYLLPRLELSRKWQFMAALTLLGALCALALSVKMNALLAVGIIAVWGLLTLVRLAGVPPGSLGTYPRRLLRAVRESPGLWVTAVLGVLTAGISLALVFIALNPLLYRHTAANIYEMLRFGQIVASYDQPESVVLDTAAKKIYRLAAMGFSVSADFRYWLGVPWLDLALAAAGGLVVLYRSTDRRLPSAQWQGWLWALIWVGITIVGVYLWTPFNWARWYLPLAPVWSLLEAVGLVFLITLAIRWGRRLLGSGRRVPAG